jgi:methylated-DNA-[protein]-cysteine S-methyltransferase
MDVLHTVDFETPVGSIRIASTAKGLAYVQLPHANGRGFDGWRLRHAPEARVQEGFEPNRRYVMQIVDFLEGKRDSFDVAVDLRATPFQSAVLEKVAKIPFGETRTYADIARAVGNPTATRAVGAANGANPISLVIPCHRVIATSGHLQGYGGGLELKAKLLAMERSLTARQGRLL